MLPMVPSMPNARVMMSRVPLPWTRPAAAPGKCQPSQPSTTQSTYQRTAWVSSAPAARGIAGALPIRNLQADGAVAVRTSLIGVSKPQVQLLEHAVEPALHSPELQALLDPLPNQLACRTRVAVALQGVAAVALAERNRQHVLLGVAARGELEQPLVATDSKAICASLTARPTRHPRRPGLKGRRPRPR